MFYLSIYSYNSTPLRYTSVLPQTKHHHTWSTAAFLRSSSAKLTLAASQGSSSNAVVRLIFNSRASFAVDLPCSTSRMNRIVFSGVKFLPSKTVPLYRL